MNGKHFGENLGKQMSKHGMSDRGMSMMLGIDENELLLLKCGEKLPTSEQIADISNALGISPDELTSCRPNVTFHSIDEYSQEEKQIMTERIRNTNERNLKQAKIIVALIVIFEIISTTVLCISQFSFADIIFNVIFFALLWKGKPWARYYYIAWACLNTVLLLSFPYLAEISMPYLLMLIIPFAIRITGGLVMAFNNSVKDFLYGQYAG